MFPIDFLFSVLYKTFKRSDPNQEGYANDGRAIKVVLLISILFAINLLSIFPKRFDHESFTFLLIPFILLNLFLFYYKKRYKNVIAKYQFKFQKRKLRLFIGKTLVILYIVLSLYPVFYAATH